MNYEKETKELNKASDTWKPEIGIHSVMIIAEPENTEYVDEVKGTVTPQIKLKVIIGKEEKDWYVTRGKTTQSAFGQLMIIGNDKGSLANTELQLIVGESMGKDGKKKRTYTFPEAMKIQQDNNVEKETVDNNNVEKETVVGQ